MQFESRIESNLHTITNKLHIHLHILFCVRIFFGEFQLHCIGWKFPIGIFKLSTLTWWWCLATFCEVNILIIFSLVEFTLILGLTQKIK